MDKTVHSSSVRLDSKKRQCMLQRRCFLYREVGCYKASIATTKSSLVRDETIYWHSRATALAAVEIGCSQVVCDICTVVYGLSVVCESRFVLLLTNCKRRRLGHHKRCKINSIYLGYQYVHIIGASNLVAEGYHIRGRESIICNVRTN